MSDLIRRQDAYKAILGETIYDSVDDVEINCGYSVLDSEGWLGGIRDALRAIEYIPSTEPERKWIPVTEKLPEDNTWYLGIFKESDTGYCISVPFVCYYAGRKTMITTKDYWILRGYDDINSKYYINLECAAWMPLPEPWRGE